jgi:Bifunctional DNA primase/polymerase, N-terminal
MTLLPYALEAAARGWSVFPVEPLGKTPGRLYPHRPKEEAPWTIKWSEVATDSISQIVAWWNSCPMANIGIACKPSGLLVVDCDVKVGEYDGVQEWFALVERYDPYNYFQDDLTHQVITGGGGVHLYYRWPSDVQASQSGLSAHVDIRSNGGQKGGYVLGAGSVTTKGTYRSEGLFHYPDQAPPWLVELCRDRPKPKPVRSGYQQPAHTGSFSGLVTAVSSASEGNRNNVLLWAARSMCEDGATLDEALDLLVAASESNGLSSRETSDTIRSAYRLQQQGR